MTTPATPPPLLRLPPSPPLPPQSGSPMGRAAPLTSRISHLTVLLHLPDYPVSLQTNNQRWIFFSLPPSNNANLFLIWPFSLKWFIGVPLISLQQHTYENTNLRAFLDNALHSPLGCRSGWVEDYLPEQLDVVESIWIARSLWTTHIKLPY